MAKHNKHNLIKRIHAVKEQLPPNYTVLYNFHFAEERPSRLRDVWNLETLDETIISNFEKLVTLKHKI
jgi:hypothetical protein